jgi:hypothetical protein
LIIYSAVIMQAAAAAAVVLSPAQIATLVASVRRELSSPLGSTVRLFLKI